MKNNKKCLRFQGAFRLMKEIGKEFHYVKNVEKLSAINMI